MSEYKYFAKSEKNAPYPRICSHRGLNTVCPENSMAAFGAAVALGATEIEMDIRFSLDGVPVVAHDSSLERVSNGSGTIEEMTFEELSKLDFGSRFSEKFAGLRILKFEDVLAKFSRQVIINLHLKSSEIPGETYPAEQMKTIVGLLRKYDHTEYVYFMGCPAVMQSAAEFAPDIPRCMGAFPEPWEIVERGIEFSCAKVQLFTPYFNQEMIDKAHRHGIRCNFFYSDDPEKAAELIKMGVDVILTNNYWLVAQSCLKNVSDN